ncbi:hypothetical protein HDU67_004328, partial [Dinochytrium kinnereticum]
GFFPLCVTRVACRPDFRITIVASIRTPDDASGQDVIRAAELAYPEHIDMHWAVGYAPGEAERVEAEEMGTKNVEDVLKSGTVHHQPLDESLLNQVLCRLSAGQREPYNSSVQYAKVDLMEEVDAQSDGVGSDPRKPNQVSPAPDASAFAVPMIQIMSSEMYEETPPIPETPLVVPSSVYEEAPPTENSVIALSVFEEAPPSSSVYEEMPPTTNNAFQPAIVPFSPSMLEEAPPSSSIYEEMPPTTDTAEQDGIVLYSQITSESPHKSSEDASSEAGVRASSCLSAISHDQSSLSSRLVPPPRHASLKQDIASSLPEATLTVSERPMVIICGPDTYTVAVESLVKKNRVVAPRSVVVLGGEVGLVG